MDKETKKGDTKTRLFSNLFWSVKKVFLYKKGYFACLCVNSMLKGITPIVMLLIIQNVIESIQYQKSDVQSIIMLLVSLSCFEFLSQLSGRLFDFFFRFIPCILRFLLNRFSLPFTQQNKTPLRHTPMRGLPKQ